MKNATTERARALRALKRRLAAGPHRHADREPPGRAVEPVPGGLAGPARELGAVPRPLRHPDREVRRTSGGSKALAALLHPFVLRRTKAEAAPELPARTELVRLVRLSRRGAALYEELRALDCSRRSPRPRRMPERDAGDVLRFSCWRRSPACASSAATRAWSTRAPHAGSSKAGYLLELLGELREGGHRALVFSQFRSFLDLLAPRVRRHGLARWYARRHHAGGGARRADGRVPGRRGRRLPDLAQGGRLRPEPHRRRHRDPPRSLVEPRRRGSGHGPRPPHRPDAAGDRDPPGGAGPSRRRCSACTPPSGRSPPACWRGASWRRRSAPTSCWPSSSRGRSRATATTEPLFAKANPRAPVPYKLGACAA